MEQASLNQIYRFDHNPSAQAEWLRKEARGTPLGVRRDQLLRIARQIEASIPGSEIRIISGLTSKADVDDWMGGNRKIAWLRSQGYAK